MTTFPRCARFLLRLHLDRRARLPSLPASELRGVLLQGFAEATGLEPQPDRPGPFVFVPEWLGPQEEPSRLEDLEAGTELEGWCLMFGQPGWNLGALLEALELVGARPWLGYHPHRTTFSAVVECLSAPSSDGLEPFDDHPLWSIDDPPPLEPRLEHLAESPTLELRTFTPLALRQGKAIAPSLGDGRQLLLSIDSRLLGLCETYGEDPRGPTFDLPHDARLEVVESHHRLIRFFRRGRGVNRDGELNKKRLPMQALLGTFIIRTPPRDVLTCLVAGEQVLAGRWPQYGLGQYVMVGERG